MDSDNDDYDDLWLYDDDDDDDDDHDDVHDYFVFKTNDIIIQLKTNGNWQTVTQNHWPTMNVAAAAALQDSGKASSSAPLKSKQAAVAPPSATAKAGKAVLYDCLYCESVSQYLFIVNSILNINIEYWILILIFIQYFYI